MPIPSDVQDSLDAFMQAAPRYNSPATPVRAMVVGAARPTLGYEPEDVLGSGFIGGLRNGPRNAVQLHGQYRPATDQSLAAMREELAQAKEVAQLVAQRAKTQAETRQSLAAAALIEKLGDLDHTDKDYNTRLAKTIAAYPEALGSKLAQELIAAKNLDRHSFVTAQQQHDAELQKVGVLKRVEEVSKDATVDPAIKAAIFDSTRGDFNQAHGISESALQQAEAARAAALKAKTPIENITSAYKALKDVDLPDDPKMDKPEQATIRAIRFNLEQAMKNKTYEAAGLGSATPAAAAVAPAPVNPSTIQTQHDQAVADASNRANAAALGDPTLTTHPWRPDTTTAPTTAAVPPAAAAPSAAPAPSATPDTAALLAKYLQVGGAKLQTPEPKDEKANDAGSE